MDSAMIARQGSCAKTTQVWNIRYTLIQKVDMNAPQVTIVQKAALLLKNVLKVPLGKIKKQQNFQIAYNAPVMLLIILKDKFRALNVEEELTVILTTVSRIASA